MNDLGKNLKVAGWCVEGRIEPLRIEAILQYLVELAEMDTAGIPAQAWTFPLIDGRGGTGQTVVQPFVELQPLSESFCTGLLPGLVINDNWPEFHHTFFLIASCKPFDPFTIKNWLHCNVGDVLSWGEFVLNSLL